MYHIIDGDGSLDIDPQSGTVVLARSLDREMTDRFEVSCSHRTIGKKLLTLFHRPVGRAVTCSSLEREVRGSNTTPVKSSIRVANDSPPLQYFIEKSCMLEGAMTWRWAPLTRYTHRRITTSIKKILNRCFVSSLSFCN